MGNNSISNLHYINRELSWLEFNERVLEEAQDSHNPLFERVKFLSIVGSNLDEFFMIRVASLQDQINAKFVKTDPAGLTPNEQIKRISLRTHKQVCDMYKCYNQSLIKSLMQEDIHFIKAENLNNVQLNFIRDYYTKYIFPVLSPMVVNKNQPFPLILNKSLNIALLLQDRAKENSIFGTIQVPSVLNRLVEIPSADTMRTFIFLEEIIKMNLEALYDNYTIMTRGCYRITRNAYLDVAEEEAEDLLTAVQLSLKQRKWGSAIRLEVEEDLNPLLLKILEEELEVSEEVEYKISGPIDITFLMKLSGLKGYDSLRYEPIKPKVQTALLEEDNDIFQAISHQDILLHHPYDSFESVVDLVKKAAEDPYVLAIKQTLYRVSGNSPIVEALAQAADNGKQVTVLLELKARFDEQNNITWAKKLETAGCHVIYGLVGLKTHCKILLIVRLEDGLIKRYVHLGTGNYNDVTAKLYTDLGLFTSNPYFGADASAVFNTLSGCSSPSRLYKMTLAPISLRKKFLDLIDQETDYAKLGKPARIIAKLNSLVDTEIIEALYKASSAGVLIDLIVRGICCLRPKIPRISENITVRSIVGRFLEHSRIYYFYGDGKELVFLSSADLMKRNLDRRVELLFPVEDHGTRDKVLNILNLFLQDNTKSRVLNFDGTYTKVHKQRECAVNCQEIFLHSDLSNDLLEKVDQVRLQFVPNIIN